MSPAREQLDLKASDLAAQAVTVIGLAGELLNEAVIDTETCNRISKDAENGYPSWALNELERIVARRLIQTQHHADEFNVFSDNLNQTLEVA